MNTNRARRAPGRPRSKTARANILKAAIDLLNEGGLTAVTVEAVAARAGVGKPTIYRYWPNAQAVAMTALMETQPQRPAPAATGSALSELRRHLKRVVATFATPTGRSAAALIAAADNDTEIAKAFRNTVILKSRSDGRALLQRAKDMGEIDGTVDEETALDILYGPIFFRLLLGHQPISSRFADQLVDLATGGLAQQAPRLRPGRSGR